ncbi:MAG: NAD(P)H-binding protein [Myxococcaceae bacterium]
MKVLVIGATGGTGRATVEELTSRGHEVTAFVRRPEALEAPGSRVRLIKGDVSNRAAVGAAVQGQDAVVVALGITENALLVRLRGSRKTPLDVRSVGTRNVVEAMREHRVRRLVVQSSYGVGETRDRLSLAWKLMFSLILKPQIADTEVQERVVRGEDLDWVLVRPVGLTDGPVGQVFESKAGETRSMKVSRAAVARFMAKAVEGSDNVGHAVALSEH